MTQVSRLLLGVDCITAISKFPAPFSPDLMMIGQYNGRLLGADCITAILKYSGPFSPNLITGL